MAKETKRNPRTKGADRRGRERLEQAVAAPRPRKRRRGNSRPARWENAAADLREARDDLERLAGEETWDFEQWRQACAKARDAVGELESLKEEYADWRSNMPESLASSPLGEKLDAVESVDTDSAGAALDDAENAGTQEAAEECSLDALGELADEADGADLPRGFGKD